MKKLPLRAITGAEPIKNFRVLCRINLLNQNFSHYELVEWSTAILCSRPLQEVKTNPVAMHVGGTYVTNT